MPQQIEEYTLQDKDGTTHKWKVIQFKPRDAMRLFARLMRILAPSISEIVGDLEIQEGGKVKVNFTGDAMGAAITQLAAQLDEDTVVKLVEDLLALTYKEEEDVMPRFDDEFQGDLGKMIKAVQKSVVVNFADFFDALPLAQKLNVAAGAAKAADAIDGASPPPS